MTSEFTYICDVIKQNESEVEKNQILFFGICYLCKKKPHGDWAIGSKDTGS